jgi:hypothetical protein
MRLLSAGRRALGQARGVMPHADPTRFSSTQGVQLGTTTTVFLSCATLDHLPERIERLTVVIDVADIGFDHSGTPG